QKQVTKNEINISSEQIIEKIDQTIEHIIDLPDFNSLITDLQSKKTRIEDRSLTIALFGAFSAGKSSFSNALLEKECYLFHQIQRLLLLTEFVLLLINIEVELSSSLTNPIPF